MFREALGYPTRPPEGGRSVLAGGISLVGIAVCLGIATLDPPYAYIALLGVVPWLLIRGYYVRVVRTTIGRTRPTPPRFGDVRRLLVDGATAVAIAAVYLFPGAVVLGPLAAVQVFEPAAVLSLAESVPSPATAVFSALVGLLAVVALMSALGALYVLPVAIARFAHSGEWRRALEVRTVLDGALTEDYATAWGVSMVLRVLAFPVVLLLSFLLVGVFLYFGVAVGVRYCYGQGVGAALGLAPVGLDRDLSDDREGAPSRETPVPAFTRIDTSRWGVSPEDGDPMPKSVGPRGGSGGSGTSVPDESVASSEPLSAETGTDGTDGLDGPRWDLPPAVRRLPDDETEPGRGPDSVPDPDR